MFRLLLAALVAIAATPGAVPAQTSSASAQPDVAEGISWLHSFEYERALGAFERAEAADSRAAMAYWGQAMCYEQLLWGNENVAEARRILARARERGAVARATPLERAWLATLDPLFGDDERLTRLRAYAAAMRALAGKYPDDPDVAAFHGLALLATRSRGLAGHHSGLDEQPQLVGSAEQEQAARIFERVLGTHPKHPGALHYLIHTWDDPANAHKALEAARVYPSVAPESSHARHMPAHVFVQLGMWAEAIASDEAAAAAADAKTAKDGLPVTAHDFHPLSWLVYEYTQAGRFDDARRALERLRGPAQATQDPRLLSLYATLRTRVEVEAGNWGALTGPDFVNYEELFGVGFSAAQRGDTSLAERARIRLAELAASPRYAERRALVEIMALQVGAAIRANNGDVDGALALLADATRAERALPTSIGPPPLIKPAQEQYAETLLMAGRFDEALAQFDGALERAPRRRLSMEGRARTVAASRSTKTRAAPIAGVVAAVIVALWALRRRRVLRANPSGARESKSKGLSRAKSRGAKSA
jgi:tetratricopeptide (TPR) repeat protein